MLLSSASALRLVARRQAAPRSTVTVTFMNWLSTPLTSDTSLQHVGNDSGIYSSINTTMTTTNTILQQQKCYMSTGKKKSKSRAINGSRGSRGHGWYLKYREGRGGRHLQGDYWDRKEQHYDMNVWNDAVLGLGCQYVYLDVAVEPPATATAIATANSVASGSNSESEDLVEQKEEYEGSDIDVTPSEGDDDDAEGADSIESKQQHVTVSSPPRTIEAAPAPLATERLVMRVASTIMPETCINFMGLCQDAAYKDTILYRIEKQVGICGGDVLTNTGKTGRCWQDFPYESKGQKLLLRPNPLRRSLPPSKEEPMAMWHVAGTVSMLCPTVNEVDSRFILCGKDAPHLDGIHRAFGTLEPQSLAKVQEWQETVLTSYGKPKSVTLRIVGCGVLENYEEAKISSSSSSNSEKQADEAA